MFVPDLGLDRLMAYRVADAGIVPWEEKTVLLPPGTGPRAAVRSGDGEHLYVMGELSSSVLHLKYRNGTAVIRQSVSALPEDFRGDSAGADVRLTPDGRFLYASNRGHDSLAMFRVDGQGDLSLLGWVSCGGKTPRNFAVDPAGRFVLAGNQDSDFIRVFSVCGDGSLAPAGDIPFPTPVCIRFLTGI